MAEYYCYVVGQAGNTGRVNADTAADAAEEYADRFREISGESYAGETVCATLVVDDELDMSETAEATI